MKIVFGKNRMTIWLKLLWIVAAFLLPVSSAWAVTAVITSGGSTDSANPTPVYIGDLIYMNGQCKKGTFETRKSARYQIQSGTTVELLDGGDRTPWLDNPTYTVSVGKTKLTEKAGTKFKVTLLCKAAYGGSDSWAHRYYEIIKKTPPKVTWDNTNPRWANNEITINIDAASTGDGVKEVYVWWTGAPRTDLQMKHIAGDRYQYKIDTSNLPEGAKDVQIWANSASGANNGWQSAGSFTVDRSAPAISWDNANPSYAKTSIAIDVNVSDATSAVTDVWIWWPEAASTSIKMNKVSGDRYRYTIDTSQLSPGKKEVQIWAKDEAGNNTGWQVKGYFSVDRLAPKITWNGTNPPFSKAATTIKANVSDATSGVDNVWIWWTGAPNTSTKMKKDFSDQYSYLIPALPDGVKDVQMWATDAAGNGTGWISKGSFIVDSTPPVVNWAEPSDQAVLSNGQIHIAGNVVDDYPDYVVIEWRQENDPAWQSHTVPIDHAAHGDFQYDLSHLVQDTKPGANYQLRLHAADKAGNVSANTPQRTVIGQVHPAVKALRLEMESMQADWKYTQDTAFDYRMTISALQWDLSGLELRYALPDGLLKNGDVRIDGEGRIDSGGNIAIRLNPDWGINDARLLSPAHSATLGARNSFIITIPVRVAKTAISGTFIQSELQAIADSLSGKVITTDRITLDAPPLDDEQLRLKKTVDKKTALPGETVHYTITFTNVSTEDLSEIVIKDTIQSAYLTLRSAQCGQSMPNGLQCCVSSEQGNQCGNAIARKSGALEWHFNGNLAAGESGSVSYEAQVNTK
jgi:uncharacterized repeat protein (TIGR01451 family)